MRLTLDLQKSDPVEDADGMLSKRGMHVAHQYAREWLRGGSRDLSLERQFPELGGLFYDIRTDIDLARMHATPNESGKEEPVEEVAKSIIPVVPLSKSGGSNIRPGSMDAAKIGKIPLPRSNLVVWLVDGAIIRNVEDVEFIGGGHHFRYPWIPRAEIWLEHDTSAEDIRFYLLHELHERGLMCAGMDYENAHAKASEVESDARKNPEGLEPAIVAAILSNIVNDK